MTPTKIVAGIVAAGALAGGGTIAADNAINPYTTVGSQLEIAASSTIPAAGTDAAIIDTTQPKVTLDKFNGEVSMGVTLQGMQATGARKFMSQEVDWQQGNETMSVTPLAASSTFEDGGYAIDLTFASEPATNVFNFSIDGAQNLDFFYQPPLWQEAGLKAPMQDCTDTDCDVPNEGQINRPDNVVGSYAVYYKNHANHIEGQTNYGTGKAYHIFRPLVTDANGATTWADLSYSSGVLTVTVPQSFLDGALYPVKVDPTFGYTTSGASNSNINGFVAGSPSVNSNNPASNGTVTKITVLYLAALSVNSKVALYDNSTNFIVGSNELTSETTSQDYTISASVTAATNYYLVAWANGTAQVLADTGSSGNVSYAKTYVTGTSGWDATLASHASTVIKSIFATYTVSGGGSTPIPILNVKGGKFILRGGTLKIKAGN